MGCYATRARRRSGRAARRGRGGHRQAAACPSCWPAAGWSTCPPASRTFGSRRRAYVKVQDGCRMECSYCIIPKVRPVCQPPGRRGARRSPPAGGPRAPRDRADGHPPGPLRSECGMMNGDSQPVAATSAHSSFILHHSSFGSPLSPCSSGSSPTSPAISACGCRASRRPRSRRS